MPRRVRLTQLEHGSPVVTSLVVRDLLADSALLRISREWAEDVKALRKAEAEKRAMLPKGRKR